MKKRSTCGKQIGNKNTFALSGVLEMISFDITKATTV